MRIVSFALIFPLAFGMAIPAVPNPDYFRPMGALHTPHDYHLNPENFQIRTRRVDTSNLDDSAGNMKRLLEKLPDRRIDPRYKSFIQKYLNMVAKSRNQ